MLFVNIRQVRYRSEKLLRSLSFVCFYKIDSHLFGSWVDCDVFLLKLRFYVAKDVLKVFKGRVGSTGQTDLAYVTVMPRMATSPPLLLAKIADDSRCK